MRILLALLALVFAGAAPALETARALADAGALQLALARPARYAAFSDGVEHLREQRYDVELEHGNQ